MMNLPEELEREFQAELKAFEESKQMKYVTTIERMAEARAKEEQKQAIALNLLRQGTLSIEAISQATGLTIEQVQQLQTANP
jgi:predicted HTH domain antitoxin